MVKSNYEQRQILQAKKSNALVNEMIAKIAAGFFIANFKEGTPW